MFTSEEMLHQSYYTTDTIQELAESLASYMENNAQIDTNAIHFLVAAAHASDICATIQEREPEFDLMPCEAIEKKAEKAFSIWKLRGLFFREDELQAFDLFADKIKTLHLKDRTAKKRHEGDTPFFCADGNPVYVCGTGSGDIHMVEILDRLRKRDFSGNLVIELYCVDPHHVLQTAVDSLRWLRARI